MAFQRQTTCFLLCRNEFERRTFMKRQSNKALSILLCVALLFGSVGVAGLLGGNTMVSNAAAGDGLPFTSVIVGGNTTPVEGPEIRITEALAENSLPKFTLAFGKNVNDVKIQSGNLEKITLWDADKNQKLEATTEGDSDTAKPNNGYLHIQPESPLLMGNYKIVVAEGIQAKSGDVTTLEYSVYFTVGGAIEPQEPKEVNLTAFMAGGSETALTKATFLVKDSEGQIVEPKVDFVTETSAGYSLVPGEYAYEARTSYPDTSQMVYLPEEGEFTVSNETTVEPLGINIPIYSKYIILTVAYETYDFSNEKDPNVFDLVMESSLEIGEKPVFNITPQYTGSATIPSENEKIITKKNGKQIDLGWDWKNTGGKKYTLTPMTALEEGNYEVIFPAGIKLIKKKTDCEYKLNFTVGNPTVAPEGDHTVTFNCNVPNFNVMAWETGDKSKVYDGKDGVIKLPVGTFTYMVSAKGYEIRVGEMIVDGDKTVDVELDLGKIELFYVSGPDGMSFLREGATKGAITGEVIQKTQPRFGIQFTKSGDTNYPDNAEKIVMTKLGETPKTIELNYEYGQYSAIMATPKEPLEIGEYTLDLKAGIATADGTTDTDYQFTFTVLEKSLKPIPEHVTTYAITMKTMPENSSSMVWVTGDKSKIYDPIDGVFHLPVGNYTYLVNSLGYEPKIENFTVTEADNGKILNVKLKEKSIALHTVTVDNVAQQISTFETTLKKEFASNTAPAMLLDFDMAVDYYFDANANKVSLKDNTGADLAIDYAKGTGLKNTKSLKITPKTPLVDGNYTLTIGTGFAGYSNGDKVVTKSDYVIKFTVGAKTTGFKPLFTYPIASAKDVDVNGTFEIAFTDTVDKGNAIANGKAVELRITEADVSVIVPAIFTLSEDQKKITVKPEAPLKYGQEYTLKVTDSIKHDSVAILPSEITFTTISMDTIGFAGTLNEGSTKLENGTVTVKNLGDKAKNVILRMEIRRDLGARELSGGTSVQILSSDKVSVEGKSTKEITFADLDISKDLYGNSVGGSTFVDIYLLNEKGIQIGNPYHQKIK